ncbi:hypothetical protein L21SP5_01398 [Salinivirga cyanobacteriivorans]|uniref:WYL domain-containing protein n=1 Tax=Salinivirga cyanobacteriivorans TaxID=1307839 RepID=A0A0S2HYF1_9BACT|nr:WYL domain-containing protein [Salinivirga cyanobacteriivorans]ALO15048.1 hypothetical protein L21SP5_01398 [Salinivirga cyanobacteriivorans]
MLEHQKIFRIFQLLARLRAPLGCKKADIAADFEVSARTVERYLSLLRSIGFHIEFHRGRYRIRSLNETRMQVEDLITFTLEEAQLIKTALENQQVKHPLQQSLLSKLYAMAEMPELTETIFDQSVSNNISLLYHAMKYKVQVVLRNYQSLNSGTVRDRLVEPIRMYRYNRYLAAWEVKDGMIKEFKTERIEKVELTEEPIRYSASYGNYGVDLFGMTGEKSTIAELELSHRAFLLLTEEFPGTEKYLTRTKNQYLLKIPVYKWEGIGRFVLGLPGEITVKGPDALKNYIKNKVGEF